jgi:hypothetical protein
VSARGDNGAAWTIVSGTDDWDSFGPEYHVIGGARYWREEAEAVSECAGLDLGGGGSLRR